MATSNKINVSFNYENIDNIYDFFSVSTSEKYINHGSYILDKPLTEFKAESVVFDNGKTLYFMVKKNKYDEYDLSKKLGDNKLKINSIPSRSIKDYILFRLFLFSINNFVYDDNKYNNITGKLFITKNEWISKNKKTFIALNINVNKDMLLSCEATTFSRSDLFNEKDISGYPKYTFSNKNFSLKRATNANDISYIKKSVFGKKANLCYFDFSSKDLTNNKIYYIYKVMDYIKDKFDSCVKFSFDELFVYKKIEKFRDNEFIDKSYKFVKNNIINLVNWSNASEYLADFSEILNSLKKYNLHIECCDKINNNSLNLIYLHNKEYYEQNHYNDPYELKNKKNIVQHITIEDCSEKIIKDNKAIINTIFKELLIKNDILNNGYISIDNWNSYNFKNNLYFGKEKNGIHYFLVIKPDGSIEFYNKVINLTSFDNPILNKLSNIMVGSNEEGETIISDGTNINLISRTNMYVIPSKDLFFLNTISRSKENREKYFDGVVDINLFKYNNEFYYNAGIKGSGMNSKIIKAPIMYKVTNIVGNIFIEEILDTMSVPFVKYNNFTILPYPFKYLNEYIQMVECAFKIAKFV